MIWISVWKCQLSLSYRPLDIFLIHILVLNFYTFYFLSFDPLISIIFSFLLSILTYLIMDDKMSLLLIFSWLIPFLESIWLGFMFFYYILLWDQLYIFGYLKTCFSKCILQLQLEWCNEKTHKIMIVEPLSALMKTYQILKYAFTKC